MIGGRRWVGRKGGGANIQNSSLGGDRGGWVDGKQLDARRLAARTCARTRVSRWPILMQAPNVAALRCAMLS